MLWGKAVVRPRGQGDRFAVSTSEGEEVEAVLVVGGCADRSAGSFRGSGDALFDDLGFGNGPTFATLSR